MKKRLYKSGTNWCFWRWTITDSEYITRLHLVKTPWFSICLHWINRPDPEPYLHDHPVSFLSLILTGGYSENRMKDGKTAQIVNHRWFNSVRASLEDRHTIVTVEPNTLTLALMGPKVREWGFHSENGWILWKDYYQAQRAERNKTKKDFVAK
jgi:hypothetical protein